MKKHINKIIFLLVVSMCLLTFAACNANNAVAESTTVKQEAKTENISATEGSESTTLTEDVSEETTLEDIKATTEASSEIETETETESETETETAYIIDDDEIFFGEYPQKIKADDVQITDTVDERGYYLGSDGAYYAKVTATPFEDLYKFSNNQKVVAGQEYYFKVEPIRWIIVQTDGETALLICGFILENAVFGGNDHNYERSDIRAYLNSEFYNTAFNEYQQSLINTVTVDNSNKTTAHPDIPTMCKDTEDKIFLPAFSEITNEQYGFEDAGTKDMYRIKLTTDYARAVGAWMYYKTDGYYGSGAWLTRTPNTPNANWIYGVHRDGTLYSHVKNDESYLGIIPMMQISLK